MAIIDLDVSQFHGFVFDFYDTLCYVNEELFLEGKRKSAQLLGIDFETFFEVWKRLGRKNIIGELYSTYDRVNGLVKELNLKIDNKLIQKVADLNDQNLSKAAHPYEEVPYVIEQLSKNYELYILSNASSSVEGVIKKFNFIFKHFKSIYFSYQHKLAKPDKRFFQLLIDNEHIEPSKFFYVGDGNDQELDIAKTFGFTTIKIDHPVMGSYRFHESKHFDYKINSLKELLNT